MGTFIGQTQTSFYNSSGNPAPAVANIPVGNALFVSTTGNDATGERENFSKQFRTPVGAIAKAQFGDTIFVYPDLYFDQYDLLRNGVNWVFHPSANVFNAAPSLTAMFDDKGLQVTCDIKGGGFFSSNLPFPFGIMLKTTNAGSIVNMHVDSMFEVGVSTDLIDIEEGLISVKARFFGGGAFVHGNAVVNLEFDTQSSAFQSGVYAADDSLVNLVSNYIDNSWLFTTHNGQMDVTANSNIWTEDDIGSITTLDDSIINYKGNYLEIFENTGIGSIGSVNNAKMNFDVNHMKHCGFFGGQDASINVWCNDFELCQITNNNSSIMNFVLGRWTGNPNYNGMLKQSTANGTENPSVYIQCKYCLQDGSNGAIVGMFHQFIRGLMDLNFDYIENAMDDRGMVVHQNGIGNGIIKLRGEWVNPFASAGSRIFYNESNSAMNYPTSFLECTSFVGRVGGLQATIKGHATNGNIDAKYFSAYGNVNDVNVTSLIGGSNINIDPQV